VPNDDPNFDATLNRAANALEHIAYFLMAIEMMLTPQNGDGYKENLHVHQHFQHEGCAACGTRAHNRQN
jgi:hypothetical protein